MSNVTKAILRAGLKGKAPCPTVKVKERRQFQWKNPRDQGDDPLSQVIELIKWSENDIIIDHLANEVGGYFISSNTMAKGSKCLHSRVAKLFDKLTNVIVVVTKSAEDKIITPKEIIDIKESLNAFMNETQELVDSAESGYWSGQ